MQIPDPFLAPLPEDVKEFPRGPYDPFPVFRPEQGEISFGFGPLARRLKERVQRDLRVLVIDGFNGVDWSQFRTRLRTALDAAGVRVSWHAMEECQKDPGTICAHLEPF